MLTKNEFEILNTIRAKGKLTYRDISTITGTSLGTINNTCKKLSSLGYIDNNGITSEGLNALEPYKVKNAVILAAGPSSRFVPLSLELPKGLFQVKGEVLIERQIKQLKEAGINDVTIVLGYKKEAFFYLKDKFDVNIIINPEFNIKNNIESLYVAKKKLGSTYICQCDTYYTANPFSLYEYKPNYSAVYTKDKLNETYVDINTKNEILKMCKGKKEGYILLGHSYWNNEFSSELIKLMDHYHDTDEYDGDFWEKLVADHLKSLPTFSIKPYPDETIFEFDYVEELRAFDDKYVNNTNSKIMTNICLVFKCEESEITGFKPIHEGMTNTSFIFNLRGKNYVYRQPGDGTDAIINRKHEKIVLEAAKKYGFDPTFIYMNDKEGWKISSFVESFREPEYNNFEDSKRILAVLRKLHSTKAPEVSWVFDPILEADKTEKLIRAKTEIQMRDFDDLKNRIHKIYEKTIGDSVEKCFCHGDTYKPNWMLTNNEVILIDWEYSGYADPGIDVGYYIVDGMYEPKEAIEFIKEYCQEAYNDELKFHYLAYTAIIAYYWFVWALYREACGAVMGESLYNWYMMAKKYSEYILSLADVKTKNLNRTEFEILKYIKENNNVENNSRFLSNMLLLSGDNVKETIRLMSEKNYINIINNILTLTDNGLTNLEAYRVDRAVIMAAGFGSRMAPVTLERPKPLVKVNGVRIIDTLIDSLLAHDIKEIYLIRGYKKEKFDELLDKYPFIKFIDNDDYNITNNISSIIKAIDHIDNCYICEADFLISNPNIISKYHYQSNYLGSRVVETDDWCYRNLDGYAYDYKKGNTNCWQAYGISYWNDEDSKKLRQFLPELFSTEKGKQEFWESIVFDFYKEYFKIEINNCSKFDIVEIDNFYELVEIDPSYENYKLNN